MIVMELMEGGSVWSQLRKKTPPPLRQRMNWAYQTCLGMSYLHRPDNKILHLDLKTANLLLDSSLSVKVADFGLSEVKKLQVIFFVCLFVFFVLPPCLPFFLFFFFRRFLSRLVKITRRKRMVLYLSRFFPPSFFYSLISLTIQRLFPPSH